MNSAPDGNHDGPLTRNISVKCIVCEFIRVEKRSFRDNEDASKKENRKVSTQQHPAIIPWQSWENKQQFTIILTCFMHSIIVLKSLIKTFKL